MSQNLNLKIESLEAQLQKCHQTIAMKDSIIKILEKNCKPRRKRVKNVIPYHERCQGLRGNGTRCTRKASAKKNDCIFCGTHIKGTPHGKISDEDVTPIQKKVTVWAQDINGIIYYIDDNNNVYDPQDIMDNKINPTVIAKWQKRVDNDGIITNDYYIPAYEKSN